MRKIDWEKQNEDAPWWGVILAFINALMSE